MAASLIFSNDKHGLTGVWRDVPKSKELPALHGLAADELSENMKRHNDIQIQKNHLENRRLRSEEYRARKENTGQA